MSVDWGYYGAEKFERINDRYLPNTGEGDTMATQLITAVNKLVFKWYNDGDVYDNTCYMEGWCNDLSSYANWILANVDGGEVLYGIGDVLDDSGYEDLLQEIADRFFDEEFLEGLDKREKVGSIYKCEGPFRFEEPEDDEDEWY